MKRWSPASYALIPAVIVVVGTSLLWQMPLDGERPSASLIAGPPSEASTLASYITESRTTGINAFGLSRGAGSGGRVIGITVTNLTGLAGQRCELHWAELRRSDLRPAEQGFWQYRDAIGWPDGLFFPVAETSELSGEVWVPQPNAYADIGRRFFIRLRLLCQGKEIARTDTAWFVAGGSLPAARSPGVPKTVFDQRRPVPLSLPRPEASPIGAVRPR